MCPNAGRSVWTRYSGSFRVYCARPSMKTERWQQISQLYDAARAVEGRARADLLHNACAGDAALQREVESLLAQEGAAENFLKHPPRFESEDSLLDLIGQQIGPHTITALLGAGGMGEVYRARDTKLGRDVAIKVLPARFTADRDRLARFEREARMLATLNHPHIGAIYGFENEGSVSALVLELVEGPTLADRLAKGPIPLTEALTIARQIAEALEAAHEKGIIHRDLKPANVKTTPDDSVKVLDFGLGKVVAGAVAADLPQSPTLTIGNTREGLIVGTAAYMSPEQARGMPVDKRTDIWSFGCVLFEMLTGKAPFPGGTISDTIAAILEHEPDWRALPADTPASVVRLLQRCLEKNLKRRLRDVGDAQLDLDQQIVVAASSVPVATGKRSGSGRSHRLLVAAASVAVAALAVTAWMRWPAPAEAGKPVTRLTVSLPGDASLLPSVAGTIAISPDGTYVAFVTGRLTPAGTQGMLYLRSLSEAQARLVSSASASLPFFSPDSEWLGFFERGKLVKMPVRGGVPIPLADAPSARGASWADDGSIVFAPASRSQLFRIGTSGGPPEALTTLDVERGETSHRFPSMLPGGKGVVYRAEGSSYTNAAIAVTRFDTRQQRILVPTGGYEPKYLPTGHLAYLQAGDLTIVPFDLERLEVAGSPRIVAERVQNFAVSTEGSLVYVPLTGQQNRLTWVSLDGRAESLPLPEGRYAHPRLSPDGQRLVVTRTDAGERDLWMYDFRLDALSRFTFTGSNSWPLWSADGSRVFYAANRPKTTWDVIWKSADGTGNETIFLSRPLSQVPRAVSPDGKLLIHSEDGADIPTGLWLVRLPDGGEPRTFARAAGVQWYPAFSPDSRWVAYVSSESGTNEVYVRPADGSAAKWQVSVGGGREPLWSPSGDRLFYRVDMKMVAVGVDARATPTFGKPQVLFEGPYEHSPIGSRNYDVSRDGQRFVMLAPATEAAAPLNIVTNWFEEVKRGTSAAK